MVEGVKVSDVVPSTLFDVSIKSVNIGSVTAKNVIASIILPKKDSSCSQERELSALALYRYTKNGRRFSSHA